MLAASLGVLPADRAGRALDFVRDRLWTIRGPRAGLGALPALIGPFLTAEEADARFAAGRDREAFDLLWRVWGYMNVQDKLLAGVAEPASTSTWEHINLDGSPYRAEDSSLAHAWSAGATRVLSERVLGIRPESAGYRSFRVEPHLGALAWAEGRVPTPRGPIAVNWTRTPQAFSLVLDVPPDSSATVAIPIPTPGPTVRVSDHGVLVWDGQAYVPASGVSGAVARGDRVDLLGVAPGRHEFGYRRIPPKPTGKDRK